ncbi:MAG: fibronectin type III domain-containing protein, partial [Bacteroidales bacterium]|nr:fibronectin type III domain-containing protein [Bacteroidales bacterium]
MGNRMKQWIGWVVVMVAAVLPQAAHAQATGLGGYTYSYGTTTSTYWRTASTNILYARAGLAARSHVYNIGFAFPFGGKYYTQFSASLDGTIHLGPRYCEDSRDLNYYNASYYYLDDNAPMIVGWGIGTGGSAYAWKTANTNTYIKYSTLGDTLLCVEFKVARSDLNTTYYNWQVHLYASGRVEMVYKKAPSAAAMNLLYGSVYMCISRTDGWQVEPDDPYGDPTGTNTTARRITNGYWDEPWVEAWPGGTATDYRYFLFTPPASTCKAPTALKATSISTTGFTVQWTAAAGVSSYVVRCDGSEHVVSGTSYTFTGLTGGDHRVYVGSICGAGDTSALPYIDVAMPFDLPYYEGFESYTTGVAWTADMGDAGAGVSWSERTMPNGWRFPGIYNGDWPGDYTNPNAWLSSVETGYASCTLPQSSNDLLLKTESCYPTAAITADRRKIAYAALPLFNVNCNTLAISFRYLFEDYDGTANTDDLKLRLGVITNVANDSMMIANFTNVQIIYANAYDGDSIGVWRTATVSLTNNCAAQTYRIAILYDNPMSGLGYRLHIDDVHVYPKSGIAAPTDLAVSNVTSTSMRLNWTAPNASYTYTIYANGSLVATTSAGATYYDLTGLTPMTEYKLAVCSNNGTQHSSLRNTIVARTACGGSLATPYEEDFDAYGTDVSTTGQAPATFPNNTLPVCWTFSGRNTWSTAGYKFTTGIDASKWNDCTSNKSLTYSSDNNGDGIVSGLKTIPFAFPLGGNTYTQFSFNEDGQIRLGGTEVVANSYYGNPLSSGGANYNNPKVVGAGCDGQKTSSGTATYGAWKGVGDTCLIVQYKMCPYGYTTSDPGIVYMPYQVQLYKSGRILMTYKALSGTAWDPSFQVGFCTDASYVWSVGSDGVSSTLSGNGSGSYLYSWPAAGRWYQWTPTTFGYPQAFLVSGSAVGKSGGACSEGDNALMLVNGRAEDVQHIALPMVSGDDLHHLIFNLSYRQSSTSSMVGELEIGTMTDPGNPSTFASLRTLERKTSWTTVRDTLGFYGLDATPRYLAFRYSGGTFHGEWTAIDDVKITYISCLPPTDVQVTNITANSMRLNWVDHSGGTTPYIINLNGTDYTCSAGTTYRDFTGLSRGQACKFTIKADCDANGYSTTRTLYATTLCGEGIDMPYKENFDYYGGRIASSTSAPSGYPTTHTLPNCWTFTGLSASTSTYPQAFITSSSSYRTDGQGLVLKTKSGQGEMYAVMPKSTSINTARLYLKFSYKYSNTTYAGQLTLGFMTDPNDAATFHAIAALPNENAYWHAVSYIFKYNAAFLSAITSAGLDTATAKVYLAFKLSAGGSSSLGYSSIDDVRMDVYSRCAGTLPYTENFDSYGSTSGYYSTSYSSLPTQYPNHYMPTCWFMPNMIESKAPGYAASYLTSYSGYYVTGKGLIFKTHSYIPNVYAVVNKDFGTSANNLAFSFSYRVNNASYGKMSYGYMTNPADTTTFVALGSTTSTSWTAVVDTFSNHTGVPATAMLAFRFSDRRSGSTTYYYGALDNVQITSVMTCPATPATGDTTATGCGNFTWHGTTYTETPATAPTHTYKTPVGNCDSIVTLHLTVIPSPSNTSVTQTSVVAHSHYWESNYPFGVTYTASGDYTYTYSTIDANGCSQVDTLHLTINPPCPTTLPYSEDFNTPLTAGNYSTMWCDPNNYPYHTMPSCWTFYNLRLKPAASPASNTTTPRAFLSDGRTGGTSNPPYRVGTSGYGLCMRSKGTETSPVAVVAVSLPPVPASRLVYSFSYLVHNSSNGSFEYGVVTDPSDPATFVSFGSTTSTSFVSVVDSLHTHATLPVEPFYLAFRMNGINGTSIGNGSLDNVMIRCWTDSTDAIASSCGSYTWGDGDGNTYTTSGTYRAVLTGQYGCDSVVHLHLTINTSDNSATTATACDSYTWSSGNGSSYTTSGNYQYSHTDANGCTQVDTLHLTIN